MSQNQPATGAKGETFDVGQLLAALLKSQAETASMQRRLLELEVGKKEAAEQKEADARARLERDRKQLLEQMQIKLKNDELKWKNCPHTDQRGGSTIYPISNWPDRQLRGTCTKCGIFIQPEHIEVDANGKKTLVPEHPLYRQVLLRDQALYSEFVPTTGY